MSTTDSPDLENQRTELRLPHAERLYVELYGAGMSADDHILAASLSVSETVDVSANGLQVRLKEALQPGTIHRLAVIREGTGERFDLRGEVKWQKRLPGSSGFMTGLALFESEHTSIAEWKLAVAAMLRVDGYTEPDRVCCPNPG